jgi:polyvinyl alcohol dehydrogenase (cytochrome)
VAGRNVGLGFRRRHRAGPRAFPTVNGVQGHGGTIDNASVVAGNGMLFVQSGYELMGVPGNLLLAFRRGGK